jgi:hypothetical protein
MAFAKLGSTVKARYLHSRLQMLNSNSADTKINIVYSKGQSLRNATSDAEQQPDEEAVPHIGGCFFK